MALRATELNKKVPGTSERLEIYLKKALNTFINPLEFDPNKYFSVSALRSSEPLWGKHFNTKRKGGGMEEALPMGAKPVLTDNAKLLNMVGAVGAKSAGFAAVAAIAHLALRRAKNQKQQKNLRKYLNAAYPIMSLDPSVRDQKSEDKEEEFGIRNVRGLEEEQEKQADEAPPASEPVINEHAKFDELSAPEGEISESDESFDEDPGKVRHDWGDPLGITMSWMNEVLDKAKLTKMPMHPVLQLAVPLAVAYGTYRGLDTILDVRERKKLEGLNARKRNILQAMMHKEYSRVRGQKEAAEEESWYQKYLPDEVGGALKAFFTGTDEIRKAPAKLQTIPRAGRNPIHFAKYGIPAGFALWAIASTALAYSMSKKHFDKADPRRRRMKNLQRFLRRRAISTNAPMFLNEEGFLLGKPDKKKKKQLSKKKSVVVPEAAEDQSPTEVDSQDPYADLLK